MLAGFWSWLIFITAEFMLNKYVEIVEKDCRDVRKTIAKVLISFLS